MRVRFRVDGVLSRGRARAEADGLRRGLPDQDHERPRHRREAGAPGRPRHASTSRTAGSTCGSHPADPARRGRDDPHPRQGEGAAEPRRPRAWTATAGARFENTSPQALRRRARHRADGLGQVDDPLRGARRDQRGRARTSSRSRTRSSTGSTASTRSASTARPASTFATGLRSMLRADPDVIMVGEIRDAETARIAIEAALTGHLVLTTLHTNDAPGAITRLAKMGIETFLTASAVDCVVAQRLARKLCAHCKRAHRDPERGARPRPASGSAPTSRPTSPSAARAATGTGYRGRIGLFSVMVMSERIKEMTVERRLGGRDRPRSRARRACSPCARTACKVRAGRHVDRRGRPRRLLSAGTPRRRSRSERRGAERDSDESRFRQRPHADGRGAGPPTCT